MSLPKTYREFRENLAADQPPPLWPESLRALWWDAKGDWENAHSIAQDIASEEGFRIHGYLHRKEGDSWNAGYWYDRANTVFPKDSLEQELEDLVNWVLANRS
jgi:hypothetical protein